VKYIGSLRFLDFLRITPYERKSAEKYHDSDLGLEKGERGDVSFTVGSRDGVESFTATLGSFDDKQRESIKEMLANASSVHEIEDIENSVRNGIFPSSLSR